MAGLRPPRRLSRLRTFSFLVAAAFATSYFIVVAATTGIWWPADVWSGAILMTGLSGFAVS